MTELSKQASDLMARLNIKEPGKSAAVEEQPEKSQPMFQKKMLPRKLNRRLVRNLRPMSSILSTKLR